MCCPLFLASRIGASVPADIINKLRVATYIIVCFSFVQLRSCLPLYLYPIDRRREFHILSPSPHIERVHYRCCYLVFLLVFFRLFVQSLRILLSTISVRGSKDLRNLFHWFHCSLNNNKLTAPHHCATCRNSPELTMTPLSFSHSCLHVRSYETQDLRCQTFHTRMHCICIPPAFRLLSSKRASNFTLYT